MTKVDSPAAPATIPGSPNVPLSAHFRQYLGRIRGGDLGSLPALGGLIVLCVAFGILRPVFFTAYNFGNMFTQGAGVTVIAMGLVFVLLLGEIDLSAGFASGVCATILSVLLAEHHMPLWISLGAAILTGVAIGLLLGFLVAKGGVPSFIVTLAAFLAFQGVVLLFLNGGKNITVDQSSSTVVYAIENKNMPPWLGWAMLAVGAVGYLAVQLQRLRSRAARGLGTDPISLIAIKAGTLIVLGGIAVYLLNNERSRNPPHRVGNAILGVSYKGVPVIVPIILVLLLIWTFVLSRTAYGRHIYAVGGNKEAARRAGISVDRIRISAFVICSFMAAIGGVVAVSRQNGVDPNTGGSNVLLYAVGAAVIGGTSLFGGRGRMIDAVLGGAVIAVIDNGMGLMGYSSAIKYIVTGAFLLLAAGVDALSRRRAAASGLR